MNFRGKWRTRSFSLAEVSQLQFEVQQYGKKITTLGIRFVANGKKVYLFAEIEPPEASQILDGLEKLGADVPPDPKLPKMVDATQRERR